MRDLKALEIQIENRSGETTESVSGTMYVEERLINVLKRHSPKKTITIDGETYRNYS